MKILILTGGSGTRLWPLSTPSIPKQFLKLGEELSLLQKTIQRFLGLVEEKDIFLVSHEKFKHLLLKEIEIFKGMNEKNLILEPSSKNTLPAITLGMLYLQQFLKNSNEIVFVAPSDHFITPEETFLQALREAESIAKEGKIITLGIQPTYPETGYGYIQSSDRQIKNGFFVEKFIEKPPLEKAEFYLNQGNFYWNSGIFGFSIKTFFEELSLHTRDLYEISVKGFEHFYDKFKELPSISIDYAIMEKSGNVAILPLNVNWNDVGSFDSLSQTLDKDSSQNYLQGNVKSFNSKRCLAISNRDKPISLVDCEDLIIIDTHEALVIMKKGSSQKIKGVAESWFQKASLTP